MRHLISIFLLVAAAITYVIGIGPLFFGTPLLGSVLVGAGLMLELAFWRRTAHPAQH